MRIFNGTSITAQQKQDGLPITHPTSSKKTGDLQKVVTNKQMLKPSESAATVP